jgi:hypothetical protein
MLLKQHIQYFFLQQITITKIFVLRDWNVQALQRYLYN